MALSNISRLARDLTTFIHSGRTFNTNERNKLNSTLNLLLSLMSSRQFNGYWNWIGSVVRKKVLSKSLMVDLGPWLPPNERQAEDRNQRKALPKET